MIISLLLVSILLILNYIKNNKVNLANLFRKEKVMHFFSESAFILGIVLAQMIIYLITVPKSEIALYPTALYDKYGQFIIDTFQIDRWLFWNAIEVVMKYVCNTLVIYGIGRLIYDKNQKDKVYYFVIICIVVNLLFYYTGLYGGFDGQVGFIDERIENVNNETKHFEGVLISIDGQYKDMIKKGAGSVGECLYNQNSSLAVLRSVFLPLVMFSIMFFEKYGDLKINKKRSKKLRNIYGSIILVLSVIGCSLVANIGAILSLIMVTVYFVSSKAFVRNRYNILVYLAVSVVPVIIMVGTLFGQKMDENNLQETTVYSYLFRDNWFMTIIFLILLVWGFFVSRPYLIKTVFVPTVVVVILLNPITNKFFEKIFDMKNVLWWLVQYPIIYAYGLITLVPKIKNKVVLDIAIMLLCMIQVFGGNNIVNHWGFHIDFKDKIEWYFAIDKSKEEISSWVDEL